MARITKEKQKEKYKLHNQKLLKCSACGILQSIETFSKNKSKIYGLSSECKKCRDGINKKWYKDNKKEKRNYQIERHIDYPWLSSLAMAKQRCNNTNFHKYEMYGAKGIKFLKSMTQEGEYLWISLWINQDFIIEQSKKYLDIGLFSKDFLKQNIHRYASEGHYQWNNCIFIPQKIHKKLEGLSMEEQKKILYKLEDFKDSVSGN